MPTTVDAGAVDVLPHRLGSDLARSTWLGFSRRP